MFPMTGAGLTLCAHTARLSVRLEPVMHAHFFCVQLSTQQSGFNGCMLSQTLRVHTSLIFCVTGHREEDCASVEDAGPE